MNDGRNKSGDRVIFQLRLGQLVLQLISGKDADHLDESCDIACGFMIFEV